jgi:hypothetical protein
MRSGFVLAFVAAFVTLSLVADRGSRPRPVTVTGTVTEWRPGVSISIGNSQTDPRVKFSLRDTEYDGNSEDIRVGTPVTIWYRGVGERHLLAERVRVLTSAVRR